MDDRQEQQLRADFEEHWRQAVDACARDEERRALAEQAKETCFRFYWQGRADERRRVESETEVPV